MTEVPDIELNNGVAMPQLGYGVFQVPPDETARAVGAALAAGYRSIDTATAYGNESGVAAGIAGSSIPRESLFVTTKLWNSDHGYDRTLRAFDASMAALGLEQLDLYLIHWPLPKRDTYVETWRALERLYADGRIRAIGVSNFGIGHLGRLMDECEVVPAVNQIELHPNLQQDELRAFHAEHGIATEAWSPLAKGELLGHPVLGKIASHHGKSAAQVVLRWHLQLGNVVIPKSVTPERIAENIAVFDFELTSDDMAAIAELENGVRAGPDPETFDVA